MTPRLLLEPEAELDLEGARIWYEERAKGLGSEFLRNVRATLAVIERQPDLFPVVHATVRRASVRRFPYSVYYVAEDTATAVIGCLHTRRDPTTWQSRR
jgi:plasmid stabilization system protein ParE